MTELKFRAWDHFNGVYYYSDKYDNLAKFFAQCQKCIDGGNKITFQQFTGLSDKKDVEIYVGDIVVIYETAKQHSLPQNVFFSDGMFKEGFEGEFETPLGFHTDKYYRGKNINMVEVIGNDHENPEILEQS